MLRPLSVSSGCVAVVLSTLLCLSKVTAAPPIAPAETPQPLSAVTAVSKLDAAVTALALHPQGATYAIGQKDLVLLNSTATHQLERRMEGAFGRVQALAWTADGSLLAIGGYQSLQLWNTDQATLVAELPGHRGSITGVAFSPDGKHLVSVSDDETARLWDLSNRTSTLLAGHSFPVNGVAWSADGTKFVTVAGDELRPTKAGEVVLRDATGQAMQTWTDHTRAALCAAFSPNGHWLVTGGLDERALVYDLPNDKLLGFFGGHQRPVNAVAFLPSSEAVVSIGGGRAKGGHSLRVWRAVDGAELAVGEGHTAKILALAVSPDGQTALTGGQDLSVLAWSLAGLTGTAPAEVVTETVATDAPATPAVIRIGVIGLDTSHAPAFAKLLNDPNAEADVAGCKVVAAYPKGSPDIKSSTDRVPGYTQQFEEMGIEIVDSIPALLEKVDCVLLETNDGRPHLEQVLPVLKAGKKCFIDKPIAGSLTDAIAIFEASKKYNTPIFSSSSLRYMAMAQEVRNGKIGKVTGCDAFSPCSLEATHPDLFWYGIHGVEILYTVMGTGCESVTRAHSDSFDLVTGTWADGRIGTFRGIRQGGSGYGGRAFGEKGVVDLGGFGGYRPLAVEIVKFFKSGELPVTAEETLELYTFMEAADESKRQGGKPVKLEEVRAKAQAAAKLPE
ncbi:hypothetical protein GC163_18950 [bacterium]|nr:hypothetical protein [bacterium]